MGDTNPLLDDRDLDFLLGEVHGLDALRELPAFAGHSAETFGLTLATLRRVAREVLFQRALRER